MQELLQNREEVATKASKAANLAFSWLYLVSTLSIIIPVLLGLALETYVIIPVGLWLNPAYTPTVHLVHDWVVGLVYVKIIGRTAMMMPANIIGQALNNTMRNDWRRGWRNPDLRIATKHLILPVTAILVAALTVPLSIAALARWTVYYEAPRETGILLYRMSYPATLITCLLILCGHYLHVLLQKWHATIRDALYLKGRQLHNFGEASPPRSAIDQEAESEAEVVEASITDLLEEMVQTVEAEG